MADSSNSVKLPRFSSPKPSQPKANAGQGSAAKPQSPSPSFSFEVGHPSTEANPPAAPREVQAYPVPHTSSHLPLLPRKKRPNLSSHRHDANPALAIKVLQDIQQSVDDWHQTLREVLLEIQEIYMEGPIVEGWLEMVQSSGKTSPFNPSILRYADPQELGKYVDRLCEEATYGQASGPQPPVGSSGDMGREIPGGEAHYRLCSLDADGRLQCQPCPPDQIPFVSMAIARNQKLRQFLSQKQYLEARLKRAFELLSQVREELGITTDPLNAPEAP